MPTRSLMPREHGAYGQLVFPLATALAAGRPTAASAAMVAGAVAAFVAHEPLLVLLGQRGTKARREDGPRARAWLLSSLGAAAALGATGLWLSPAEARLAALAPLAVAAPTTALVFARREKTLAGELLAASAMSAAALPVGVASGLSMQTSLLIAASWAFCFGLATFGVRHVIAAAKGEVRAPWPVLAAAGAALGLGWLARSGYFPIESLIGLAPVSALTVGLAIARPHPRHLKRVGWALIAASTLTFVALVVAARALLPGS